MLHLDHAIIFARNLAAAAEDYRRLGFTLTPKGDHPTLGTANHTIMFGRDYLELLEVVHRTPASEQWARILDRREGFGAMALGTQDAGATRRQLLERGIEVPPPIEFSRPVNLPGGTVQARFTVAHVPDAATPALPAFFCQQHTPENVWRPEWQHHANTALGIASLTVVDADPDRLAPAYERLIGRAFVHPHPGGFAVDLRGTRLWIVRPEFAAERLGTPLMWSRQPTPVGVSIGIRDLDAARSLLTENKVRFQPFGRRSILIGPSAARGVHLEFIEAAT